MTGEQARPILRCALSASKRSRWPKVAMRTRPKSFSRPWVVKAGRRSPRRGPC